MIPILGVPILNRPDLLAEMLATVDHPVGQLIVIDNGDVVEPGAYELVRPGRNLGVAASWNRILSWEAPWWAIVNFDLTFAPGDLAKLDAFMDGRTEPTLALLGTFSAFAVNEAAIQAAGTFDENFHPAYFEDNDFYYRCRLAGVGLHKLDSGLLHRTSSTIGSERVYANENARTFPYNALYYKQKWGGPPREERFLTPFDAGGDIRHWRINQSRLDNQTWRKP